MRGGVFMKRLFMSLLLWLSAVLIVSAQDTDTPDPRIEAIMAASTPITLQAVINETHSAIVTSYPCVSIDGEKLSYERLDIKTLESGESSLVADQLINCGGLGAFGLASLRWSDDGAFLYYTDAREGVPDGLVFGSFLTVWRLTLADSTIENLGIGQFSFDTEHWVTWDEEHIRLTSTHEEKEFSLEPPDLVVIKVEWLPDSAGVLYIQADIPGPSTRSTVTYIDVETQEQTVLIDTQD
jgi:hypothetical protein